MNLTLTEVAEALNVHYMTVYRYVREGMLPATRINRSWQVKRSDLKEFELARAGNTKQISKSASKISNKARHGARDTAPWVERIVSRLTAGDERGSLKVLEAALRSGHDIHDIYIDVLLPALVEIGDLWRRKKIDVYVEHRASVIVIRLISQISPRFLRRGLDRGTIVVGTPEGEQHSVGISIIADLLRFEGWNVFNLGANLPAIEFAKVVKNTQDLVAVCVITTMSDSLRETSKSISAIRKVAHRDIKCFVGGAAIKSNEHAQKLGADHWVANPRDFFASLDLLSSKAS